MVYGQSDERMKTVVRPAGAAPADRFGTRFDGKAQDDFIHVLVGDVPFVAGVSSDRAAMWERPLHADYPTTDSYKALFHAGLLLSEMDKVDTLVTGLPVSQFKNGDHVKAIEQRFLGVHQVTPKRAVEVKAVKVIPQPVGGLLAFMNEQAHAKDKVGLQIDDDARVLVVDPGFYSLDWVLVSNGEVQRHSSGTSVKASSVLLELAAKLIAEDHGAAPPIESLEAAMRSNKPSILVMGAKVELQPYIQKASENLESVTADSIQKSLRIENLSPDIVVMVGGGAPFFRNAVANAFSRLEVVMPANPVQANATGFWLMGALTSGQ
ncbi:ParM/StbA family protein [Acidovorax sp. sic0104]|nr:ParM/StbA family protein [Acidovorax sp. sic0104]